MWNGSPVTREFLEDGEKRKYISVYHSLLTLNGIVSYLYLCIYENILLCNSYHEKDFQDQYSWDFECCEYSWFGLGFFTI